MRIFPPLILFISMAFPAQAQEDPREVMEVFLNDLRTIWVPLNRQENASYDSRRAWTQDLINKRLDFPHMSRRSMGPRWRKMTQEQQGLYRELFRDALTETVIDWLDAYDGEVFEIQSIRNSGQNTEIRTRFVTENGTNLNTTWVTRETTGFYLIRDVRVSGISLIADFRSKYRRIIENNGLDEFFDILAADTAQLRAKQS